MSSYGHQPAVFDSHPPELYGSVGGPSERGGGYLRREESLAAPVGGGDGSGSGTVSAYMSLSDRGRDPGNEYDYIPGETLNSIRAARLPPLPPGERRGVGEDDKKTDLRVGEGERKVTDNSMYEKHDVKPLLHPTVTRKEETGGGLEEEEEEEELRVCVCKTKSLVVAFFIAMAVLLAVASLGLAVLMWVGVNSNSSEEEGGLSDVTTDSPECNCLDHIALLREALERTEARINDMNSTVFDLKNLTTEEIPPAALERLERTENKLDNITDLFYSEPPPLHLFNVSHVSGACVTTVVSTCELPRGQGTNCTTDFVHLNDTGTFVLQTQCRYKYEEKSDFTILAATLALEGDSGALGCVCVRLGEPVIPVECQLVAASCPVVFDLGG